MLNDYSSRLILRFCSFTSLNIGFPPLVRSQLYTISSIVPFFARIPKNLLRLYEIYNIIKNSSSIIERELYIFTLLFVQSGD